MEKFSNYDLSKQIITKEASFRSNVVEEEQGCALEEAMENLAYAATATNTQINTLTKTNAELSEQLKKAVNTIMKLTEGNSKLLTIIEKSVLYAPLTPGTPKSTTPTTP
eukprot:492791-Ditylum_brightwellii.AAC.1